MDGWLATGYIATCSTYGCICILLLLLGYIVLMDVFVYYYILYVEGRRYTHVLMDVFVYRTTMHVEGRRYTHVNA